MMIWEGGRGREGGRKGGSEGRREGEERGVDREDDVGGEVKLHPNRACDDGREGGRAGGRTDLANVVEFVPILVIFVQVSVKRFKFRPTGDREV
jgi:hypothetical protein